MSGGPDRYPGNWGLVPSVEDDPGPLRLLVRPTRALTSAGIALTAVGALLPWATAYTRDGIVVIDGFRGGGDAAILLALGIGLLVLVSNAGAASSRTRVVQVLPGLLGVVALLVVVGAVRALAAREAALDPTRERLELLPGIAIVCVGSALMALGGLATSIEVARMHRPRPGDMPPILEPGFVEEAAAGAVFGIVGAVAPVVGAVALWGGSPTGVVYLLPIATFGFFIGGIVGLSTGSGLVRWRRRRR